MLLCLVTGNNEISIYKVHCGQNYTRCSSVPIFDFEHY